MLDRRLFLGAGIAGASALTFSSVWSQSAPNFGPPTLPSVGFKRMKLGNMEVIALNDGAVRRPLGEEFVTNAPLEQVKALLASQNLPTDYIDVPYTPFLLINGNQRYLFDTGFADNGPPTTGKLLGNLAAAGFKPEDINNVVLSHFHGDHINGLRFKNGSLVYPNARVHVPAPEHAPLHAVACRRARHQPGRREGRADRPFLGREQAALHQLRHRHPEGRHRRRLRRRPRQHLLPRAHEVSGPVHARRDQLAGPGGCRGPHPPGRLSIPMQGTRSRYKGRTGPEADKMEARRGKQRGKGHALSHSGTANYPGCCSLTLRVTKSSLTVRVTIAR